MGNNSKTGSVLVQDSVFEKVQKASLIAPTSRGAGADSTGITLDNITYKNCKTGFVDVNGI
jgi:hypothetical protein